MNQGRGSSVSQEKGFVVQNQNGDVPIPATLEKPVMQTPNDVQETGMQRNQIEADNWEDLLGIYTRFLQDETCSLPPNCNPNSNVVGLDSREPTIQGVTPIATHNRVPQNFKPPGSLPELITGQQNVRNVAPVENRLPLSLNSTRATGLNHREHSVQDVTPVHKLSSLNQNGTSVRKAVPPRRVNSFAELIGTSSLNARPANGGRITHIVDKPSSIAPSSHDQRNWKNYKSDGMVLLQNHMLHTTADTGAQNLQQIPEGIVPVPYGSSHYPHLPPRSEARESSSAARLVQLTPITADQQKDLMNNKSSDIPDSLIDNSSTQENGKQDSVVLPYQPKTVEGEHDDLLHDALGTSSTANSTRPKERQNSDAGNDGEVNKTPQSKTPKRKKHRPKVVVEGKPKRTPKPAVTKNNSPNGIPSTKRKYVRKNSSDTPTNQSTDAANEIDALSNVDSEVKSGKRMLNFDLENGAEKKSKVREFDHWGKNNEGGNVSCNLNLESHDRERLTELNRESTSAVSGNQFQKQANLCAEHMAHITSDQHAKGQETRSLTASCHLSSTSQRDPKYTQGDETKDSPARVLVKRTARQKSSNKMPKAVQPETKNLPVYGHHSRVTAREDTRNTFSVEDITDQMRYLHIDSKGKNIVGEESSALVPYRGDGAVVPYEAIHPIKKCQPRPKVNLDPETNRLWNLLMSKEGSESAEAMDNDKQKWWEEEREVVSGRVHSFIARMHLVQGNRRFSKWKGSVVDSVVGVFLTQNVSDHLSSSAFMSLAAKFPIKSTIIRELCHQNKGNLLIEHGLLANGIGKEHAHDLAGQSAESNPRDQQSGRHQFQPSTMNRDISSKHIKQKTNLLAGSQSRRAYFDIDNVIADKWSGSTPEPAEKNVNSSDVPPRKTTSNARKRKAEKEKAEPFNWDTLRKQVQTKPGTTGRSRDTMDSLDYEALRNADVRDISAAIKERGMNNMLAERIKDFLNRLVRDHERIDLEWLRGVQPDKAKDYLLSIRGLGLKSVECVRLLTLHHLAFPVDINVARVAVRLGWVPLQPLPEKLQLHLLELYPVLESVQKYLWPRLCMLDQETLYELHYQLITFGKVFCTKIDPNCNACPMRGECRHFASAFASARLALPGPEERRIVNSAAPMCSSDCSPSESNLGRGMGFTRNCEPIIEEPKTPESPVEVSERDIEDAFYEDPDEIPVMPLNIEEFTTNLQSITDKMEMQEGDMIKSLVALSPEIASIPTPKLKHISRLRTEHQVYELPDSHPLLKGLDKREADDPSPYLLALWRPGETADSVQPPENKCSSPEDGLCNNKTCFSCNSIREEEAQIVRGTILIPCRTAMRGSFPLNGTYFQVNEVFADHETSWNPIDVPRDLVWNLPRRTVFFGTSVSTISRGLTTEGVQFCFQKGFVCVRAFDQKYRAPRPLTSRFHQPTSKIAKRKD